MINRKNAFHPGFKVGLYNFYFYFTNFSLSHNLCHYAKHVMPRCETCLCSCVKFVLSSTEKVLNIFFGSQTILIFEEKYKYSLFYKFCSAVCKVSLRSWCIKCLMSVSSTIVTSDAVTDFNRVFYKMI